ncbi:hypothetical protein BD289DRAFT_366477 [Coniella lustricola]|uniref:Large ribosomal subunit protein bL21m n=1 Tax=Coniella lustricola TaxID=2025994 RepID=A0A2T3AAT2_9PEZI|nr:hypothetical protein BD289DRAFT_366477 [Coniella lustricola]
MNTSLMRSALELRSPMTRLPPTYLLPIRARWISSTAQASAPSPASTTIPTALPPHPASSTARTAPSAPAASPPTGPIPESIKQLLPLLRSQPAHYITIHIHGRPYLVTPGDSIRLPFLMPGVVPGDVLRLNRASVLGSRDYTLRPTDPSARKPGTHEVAYVDERLYECRATVVGVESEPLRSKQKTKRRNRRVRTIKSKHRYTVLRITDLKIRDPGEIEV